MSTANLGDLFKQVASTSDQASTESGRQTALQAAQALVYALQTPAELVSRLSFLEPLVYAAVAIGIELGLFKVLKESHGAAKSTDELASASNAHVEFLARILRQLAVGGVIIEVGRDTYLSTPMSNMLATSGGSGTFKHSFDCIPLINSKIIEYLRSRGFKSPTGKSDSMFQFAAGTNLHYFEWILQPGNEDILQSFNDHMTIKTMGTKWYEAIPVEQILGGPTNPNEVLLVDVGGNTGIDIAGFHKAHPQLPGRLILQDLPGTLAHVDKQALRPVEFMPHDFFTEQPVKGAKAYYMKMILHDWPDSVCQQILQNLKPALTPGHSKILINEIVMPEEGARPFETCADMLMMMVLSSKERRQRDWEELLGDAGLKIVKVWKCGEAVEKLIEVELA